MLVSCPSCQKQYHFPLEAYKASKVRCTACQHVWSPSVSRYPTAEAVVGEGEGLSPLSKPIIFSSYTDGEVRASRFPRFFIKLDWILLSFSLIVGVFFAYYERDSFLKFFPTRTQEETLQKTQNFLSIEGVFYRFDNQKVIVTGQVINPTADVLDVPFLSLMIHPRDHKEKTYKTWVHTFETTKILPNERLFFETEIDVEKTFTPDDYKIYVQFS